ncbi:MAG: HEPN domain-containing protein [Oscillospiraceae bacterium]|nr:HEPN domain-containing protein [Oscillospiraceae bacterium]
MRSVLALENKDFKSHAKAIGYFNKEYINKGLFPAGFSRKISGAFKTRARSDYDDFFTATSKEAETTLNNAHQFVEEVEKYLAVRLEVEAPPSAFPHGIVRFHRRAPFRPFDHGVHCFQKYVHFRLPPPICVCHIRETLLLFHLPHLACYSTPCNVIAASHLRRFIQRLLREHVQKQNRCQDQSGKSARHRGGKGERRPLRPPCQKAP